MVRCTGLFGMTWGNFPLQDLDPPSPGQPHQSFIAVWLSYSISFSYDLYYSILYTIVFTFLSYSWLFLIISVNSSHLIIWTNVSIPTFSLKFLLMYYWGLNIPNILHSHFYSSTAFEIFSTRSLGALRAPTSSWRPFGLLDFVLRALQALRPCDPCACNWIECKPVNSALAVG